MRRVRRSGPGDSADLGLTTVLTTIQVNIADLSGEIAAMRESISGQLRVSEERIRRNAVDIDRLANKVRDVDKRADDLEADRDQARGRTTALAGVAGLFSGAVATALLRAVTS